MQTTCKRLVNDALDGDKVAMAALDRQYRPWLEEWARKRFSIQAVDAEDLVSELLQRLLFSLTSFQYDPQRSFRGWLRTALRNEFLKSIRKPSGMSLTDSLVEKLSDHNQDYDELENLILAEAKSLRVEVWLPTARQRCKHPMHWRAYELMAIQGKSLAEVAEHLDANRLTVSTWAYRFQQVYLQVVHQQYLEMCNYDEGSQ